MKATVAISTPTGSELLSVSVNDCDPFTVLTIRHLEIHLTRDECRKAQARSAPPPCENQMTAIPRRHRQT
jgi:hypothetical protein